MDEKWAARDGVARTLWMPESALPLLLVIAFGVLVGPDLLRAKATDLNGLLILLALFGLPTLWVARARVRATPDELIHYGILSKRVIPAGELQPIVVRRPAMGMQVPYPLVVLKDGTRVGLTALGGVLVGAGKAATQLNAYYALPSGSSRSNRSAHSSNGSNR